MFSLLNIALFFNLIVMSDCDHFWDVSKISKEAEIEWDSLHPEALVDFNELKGKKILLLVHGYNNSPQRAMETYHLINNHIMELKDADGNAFYDAIIGYLWPGYKESLEYFAAEEHTRELAKRARSHLMLLSEMVDKVDVLAHSMGNRLIFEALDFAPQKLMRSPVQNFYSLAAAVDNESIEKHKKYYHAAQNCQNLYIFYSHNDEVLKFLYSLSEFDEALGYEGVENLKKLPANARLIDCSAYIDAHSQYFSTAAIYEFIQTQLQGSTPDISQVIKLP